MQQGAKRAATPAKKEAINDALIKSSINKLMLLFILTVIFH